MSRLISIHEYVIIIISSPVVFQGTAARTTTAVRTSCTNCRSSVAFQESHMMDAEATEYQQRLLHDYRRTLAHLLRTAAQYGGESFVPPAVANGITEARQYIQHIKEKLHAAGIEVVDE